ncbi:MAG: SulP family inorganic anion transporter [Clostridiales bacterium]|nr:SulP family inorganic anion transporter [Clostridiales bacterium]
MSKNKRPFFSHYAKIFRNEFKGYNSKYFINDLTAGITVGAVALPLALAFGAASVDQEHMAIGIAGGLITAIIAGIVSGLLGGGSFQISGPTGAMAVILGTIVSGTYGLQGMFMATFISGVILLVLGLLRFGRFIQFIPKPVVTGFTSGIALVIAIGQLGNAFGVDASGEGTVGKVITFAGNIGDTSWQTLVVAGLVVLIMALYPKKLSQYVPSSLVAIIIATVAAIVFKLDVKTIGSIPKSIINSETLDIRSVDLAMLTSIGKYAVTIALLGMIESLLCGTAAASMKKEKFDSNVELIAQGIANMAVPFAGGVPSTAAIARTSVAIKSGCRTRLTSVFQSVFLILCMFVLAPLIGMVPYSALAGVLFVTAFKMNDLKTIKSYFTHGLKDAIALCFVTMAATVVLDLTYAIVIGVILSMIITISKLADIRVNVEEETLMDSRDVAIVYSVGTYFFANGKQLKKAIEKCGKKYETYILSFRGVVFVDVSAETEFLEAIDYIRSIGADFCFVGLNEDVRSALEKIGFQETVGRDHFYANLEEYVATGLNMK